MNAPRPFMVELGFRLGLVPLRMILRLCLTRRCGPSYVELAMLVAVTCYAIIMPGYGYTAAELLALNTTNATCF